MNETTEIIDGLISFLCIEIEYIQICIKNNCAIPKQQLKKSTIGKRLQWTASKISLVELIYALYFAGCISNGNGAAKIKEIKEIFEEMFSIDLGECSRTYIGVKQRILVQPKFLRNLLKLVEENIADSDKK